jgi:ParB/RepB/Spo0J family partition protein
MARTTQQVAITDIEIPKSRDRKIDWTVEAHARFLNSLRRDGLQQPILLQPPREQGDRYRLVFGVERTKGAKQLGWEVIRAEVDDGITDEEATMAALAENLFRAGQKEDTAYRKALRLWWEAHEKRLGGKNDKAAEAATKPRSGGKFAAKDSVAQTSQLSPTTSLTMRLVVDKNEEDEETDAGEPPAATQTAQPAREKPFAQQVQELTGCSRAESFRDAAVARAFTTEELEEFAYRGCSEKHLQMIAALDQPDDIRAAVRLVSLGYTPEEAIEGARSAAEAMRDDEDDPARMSDARWLETQCTGCRSRLSNTAAFDQAALNYRMAVPALKRLKGELGKMVREAARSKRYDPFTALVAKITSVKYPDEWPVCAMCSGTGQDSEEPDKWCSPCHGAGFYLDYEKKKEK